MKTVSFNNSNRSYVRTFLMLAGLAGLYMYYRRGGKTSELLSRGLDLARGARQSLGTAVGEGTRSAPEISTTPEAMDRFQST